MPPTVSDANLNIEWTTEQNQVTLEYWKKKIHENIEPTATEVAHFKRQYSCMKNKTRAKIKAFVLNKYIKAASVENDFELHEDNNDICLDEQGCNSLYANIYLFLKILIKLQINTTRKHYGLIRRLDGLQSKNKLQWNTSKKTYGKI